MPLRLVYFRPGDAGCTALDRKVFDLAARYRARVELVVRHVYEAGEQLGAWVSERSPTLLFVRRDRAVAQAIGDLPRRELEALLDAALA
jgi:hypothetical protein